MCGHAGRLQAVAATPWRMKKRTTCVARAVDSSQFVGNCELAIGRLSVWPSTTIGWRTSVTSRRAIAVSSPAEDGWRCAWPLANSDAVGQQPDDEPAARDRRLQRGLQAVLAARRRRSAP